MPFNPEALNQPQRQPTRDLFRCEKHPEMVMFPGAPCPKCMIEQGSVPRQRPEAPDKSLWPQIVHDAPKDADGYPIPPTWQYSVRWGLLPITKRRDWSAVWVQMEIDRERDAKIIAANPRKRTKGDNARSNNASRFTTDYGIRSDRLRKRPDGSYWKLIEREYYNHHTKRHHDLMLGLDALFDDGLPGMAGRQYAGKGERAEHWRRFCERGGVELANRRLIRVTYFEFERGSIKPIKEEVWA